MELVFFTQAKENLLHDPCFPCLAGRPDRKVVAAFLGIFSNQLSICLVD
jgi:hypothetical protein